MASDWLLVSTKVISKYQEGSAIFKPTRAIGYGHDSDRQDATTYSSINTANLTINDRAGQQALTGQSVEETIAQANHGISLETAKANSGALIDTFDADKVQQELDAQVAITKDFGQIAPQITAEVADTLAHQQAYEQATLFIKAGESKY